MPNDQSLLTKLTIVSFDDPTVGVVAQYNPKELSFDKSFGWSKHDGTKGEKPAMEFTGAEPRSTSIELVFDGYEDAELAIRKPTESKISQVSKTVKDAVETLMTLASVRDPKEKKDEKLRRPHIVLVVWGDTFMRGVIESVNAKYTMFDPTGVPLRATVTVKIKELADDMEARPAAAGGGAAGAGGAGAGGGR